MYFMILVYYKDGRLRLKAEQIYKSGQVERYKISGRNRAIVLQNNYPFLESRKSGKGRVQWKLIVGIMNDSQLLSSIITQLEYKRKEVSKTSPSPSPHN